MAMSPSPLRWYEALALAALLLAWVLWRPRWPPGGWRGPRGYYRRR